MAKCILWAKYTFEINPEEEGEKHFWDRFLFKELGILKGAGSNYVQCSLERILGEKQYPCFAKVLSLIHKTPFLEWFLTIREIDRVPPSLAEVVKLSCTSQDELDGQELAKQWLHGSALPNIRLMGIINSQEEVDRMCSALLSICCSFHGLLVSFVGPIDLHSWLRCLEGPGDAPFGVESPTKAVDWVVLDHDAYIAPKEVLWVRGLIRQCCRAGVPVFVHIKGVADVENRKLSEVPEELQVQEFP